LKLESLVKTIFGVVAIIIVVTIILVGVITTVAIKGCQKVQEKGLKNVATEVWEGPSSNAVSSNE